MILSIRKKGSHLSGSIAVLFAALAAFVLVGCAAGGDGMMSGGAMIPRSDNLDPQMSWPYNPVQYASNGGKFYINGQNEGFVTVFDARTQKKLKVINFWEYEYDKLRKMGKTVDEKAKDFIQKNARPHHSWIVPGGRYNYVSNNSRGWDRFWVVDTYTDEIVAHFNTRGTGPLHGAFSPFRDLAVFGAVQDRKKGVATFIDFKNHKVLGTVKTTGLQTRDVVFTPDNKHVYITNSGWNPKKGIMGGVDMINIDTMKVVKTFKIDGSRAMKMTSDGKIAGVVSIRKGSVTFIDMVKHEIIGTVKVGNRPNNISFNPGNTKAYIGIQKDKVFTVVDMKTLKVKTKIPAGKNANSLYFPPGNNKIAIGTSEADDFVSIVDTVNDRLIKTIDTPLGAHNVAYTADGKIAIVSCRKSREAVFIDVEKLEEIVVIDKAGYGNNGVRWAPYGPGRNSMNPYGS